MGCSCHGKHDFGLFNNYCYWSSGNNNSLGGTNPHYRNDVLRNIMALKLSINTSNVGVPFAEAYARITNIYGNKDQVQYQVSVSANADARQANAQEVAQHAFYCSTPTDNLMASLYADLKNQAGFENAIDC